MGITARTLKRITTDGGVMRIQIDQPQGDGDGGFQLGGSVESFPKGDPQYRDLQVTDHAARVIMADPGLARHFDCQPPIEPAAAATDKKAAKARPAADVSDKPAE